MSTEEEPGHVVNIYKETISVDRIWSEYKILIASWAFPFQGTKIETNINKLKDAIRVIES